MNKYVLFMSMVLFLIVITLLVEYIDLTVSNSIIIDNVPTGEDFNIFTSLGNFVSIFFRILSFNVPSLPGIFNLLVFYPLTAGILFMLIDIIRGNG